MTGARDGARAAGFTLLEVMVALAVVAIAFTALLGLHARNLRLAAREEAYTQSLFLARNLITEIELGDFPEIGTAEGDFESRHPGEYPDYVWQRRVVGTLFPDLREVSYRVMPRGRPDAAADLTLVVRREPT